MDTIYLLNGTQKKIAEGHPWIYRTQIERTSWETEARPAPLPGSLTEVCDYRHRYLGTGIYNPHSMITVRVNGTERRYDGDPAMPLLWFLRDELGLTGTKYGCGIAQCGACTVHIDGEAVRSCVVPVSAAEGKQITTIEGLAVNGVLTKVQKAWLEHDVPQCGYCQSGMIMAVTALLNEKSKPTDADIDAAITNICRCGTFQQVRAAIHTAAKA